MPLRAKPVRTISIVTGLSGLVKSQDLRTHLSFIKCDERLAETSTVSWSRRCAFATHESSSNASLIAALTSEERNQTMGHHGSTYEEFYMPDLIERDFQAIYFGTPSQDDLIRSVARMGLSRDMRAPYVLTAEQKEEVHNSPELEELRKKRERYKNKLYKQGYYPVAEGKGTRAYERYKKYDKAIGTKANTLRIRRLKSAIREFHETIDEIEISQQLSGLAVPEILTRPAAQYELRERASIVKLMPVSLNELNESEALRMRIKFVHKLARLCHRQESRKSSPVKRAGQHEGVQDTKRMRSLTGVHDRPEPCTPSKACNSVAMQLEDAELIDEAYPMRFERSICLICIGDGQKSREEHLRPFARKDALKRHLDLHVKQGVFKNGFRCKHPECSAWLRTVEHYMNHAATVHDVWH